MPIDVQVETTIDCARHVVAAYAADPDHAPVWYDNITGVRWVSEKKLAVGARMEFEAHFLGRRLAYIYEIRELVPGERLVMSTDARPFPMETTYTWEDAPAGGTRMTLRNRGQPSGFSKVAAPVMAAGVRRNTKRNLAELKRLLEKE